MTTQVTCEIYYSVAGEPFGIHELKTAPILHAPTVIYIYTHDIEELPDKTAVQSLAGKVTELSVPRPIKKGRFFNSESYCLFLNEAGAVLKIGEHHLFKVQMMRDGNDHERLHIKFGQQYFAGRHQWVSIADQDYPKAPPVVL